MFAFRRKALAGIGVTATTIAAVGLSALPAHAAAPGDAAVIGSSTVRFGAAAGATNALVMTIEGRTVTLDDRTDIRAGRGCEAVSGDRTKVRCTTATSTERLLVTLGDRDDSVTNETTIRLLARGGAGDDVISGGARDDRLRGDAGGDTIHGGAGQDLITGGDGNDYLFGDAGDDAISGDAGDDLLVGEILIDIGRGDQVAGGSNSALDVLDGGSADRADYCVAMDAATAVGCEIIQTGRPAS